MNSWCMKILRLRKCGVSILIYTHIFYIPLQEPMTAAKYKLNMQRNWKQNEIDKMIY
jgi:hypothetical protein